MGFKVPVCSNPNCGERCLPAWASIGSVCFGSLIVGGLGAFKYGIVTSNSGLSDMFRTETIIGFVAIAVFTIIAVVCALFERFDHPLTAFIYGASTPGLVFGIANLLAAH